MDDETIGALETALANTTDEIEALRNHIMERDTEIDNLTAALSVEQGKNKTLQRIAADLNAENVGLKQRIARLESGKKQTVYPWKAE
jgi:chromosome segregation ATPase